MHGHRNHREPATVSTPATGLKAGYLIAHPRNQLGSGVYTSQGRGRVSPPCHHP